MQTLQELVTQLLSDIEGAKGDHPISDILCTFCIPGSR